MNPDVFITIAFGGFVVLITLVATLFVVPRIRRDDARINAARKGARASGGDKSAGGGPHGHAKRGPDAAIH
jgi:hypothetical protein